MTTSIAHSSKGILQRLAEFRDRFGVKGTFFKLFDARQ